MIAYVDSSVLLDRAIALANGAAPPLMTAQGRASLVTSALTQVEVCRVLRRLGRVDQLSERAETALTDVSLLDVGAATLSTATQLPVRHLKSLDAIHVASALITRCDVVLTRDRQMARACEELGLQVA